MSRDIQASMMVIRDLADKVAGSELPDAERETVKILAGAGLTLLERLLLDVNRIADALEVLATKE
jgi:hypothetical protein